MSLPPSHRPLTTSGITYDLSHLDRFGVKVAGKGKIKGEDLGIIVVFSNHVYTERTKYPDPHDTIDHHGTKRTFDPDRYEMSKKLPEIIHNALMNDTETFPSDSFTGRTNLIIVEADGGEIWSIVFCFEPIANGIRMEVLSSHPKAPKDRKVARNSIIYYARICIFSEERIPKN